MLMTPKENAVAHINKFGYGSFIYVVQKKIKDCPSPVHTRDPSSHCGCHKWMAPYMPHKCSKLQV